MKRKADNPEKPASLWQRLWKRKAIPYRFRRRQDRRALFEALLARPYAGTPMAEDERQMLKNVLEAGNRHVEDVMVPRADIVAVEEKTPASEILAVSLKAGHSRLPVYREELDQPLGIVHIKDIIAPSENCGGDARATSLASFNLKDSMRTPLFVPPSMPVLTLLRKMQAARIHLALVIDEHGGTCGLVSIEDLVEEIVGEIEDEHDEVMPPPFKKMAGGMIEADARTPIEEIEKFLETDLEGDEDVTTLGGLLFTQIGRLPKRGEKIRHPSGVLFEVLDASSRRIKRIRLHPPKKSQEKTSQSPKPPSRAP